MKLLKPLAFATMLLSAGAANATDLEELTLSEREAFRAEVRAYLLENPEVLMEALDVLEQRQAVAEVMQDQVLVATNADAIFASPFDYVGGNPEGDITLVEFLDYRCGYCRRVFPDVERLIEEDGNIRFIIKELPILGEASVLATRFALSAKMIAGDEAYRDLHDAMMVMRADVSEASLMALATELGLDGDAIMNNIGSSEITEVIETNYALAQRLNISGTPSFIMNDQMLRGAVPFDTMATLAEELRAAAN